MKNVAATSGQSVNFATLFFADGITWEGICAGSDMVLNFFLSSSRSDSRFPKTAKQGHFRRIQSLHSHARKKCISLHIFSKQHLNLRTGTLPDAFATVVTTPRYAASPMRAGPFAAPRKLYTEPLTIFDATRPSFWLC
jgi:hypothetical protein